VLTTPARIGGKVRLNTVGEGFRQVAEKDVVDQAAPGSPSGFAGEGDAAAAPPPPTQVRKNRELFQYLIETFKTMLPPDKAAQLGALGEDLLKAVEDNCGACLQARKAPEVERDPRRSRFLLRLVVGKVSHLFSGPKATMPRTLIEALDRYMKKAFGSMIYDELNAEADQLLFHLNCDDDKEMWQKIRENPDWARFVDTVFIRILFRFENFSHGKKVFMTNLDATMQDLSKRSFTEDNFFAVFEALFSDLYEHMEQEDQRLRWDFHFGDGTCKRISGILDQGLVNYLKKRNSRLLGSGRAIPTDKPLTFKK